jgi:hypothetical protein
MQFVLFDVLQADRQWQQTPAFASQVDRDTAQAMLGEAARITEERIAPLNRSGDEEGAQWHNGKVTTPAGFVEAYRTWREGGFTALTGNPEFGGLGMPKALAVLVDEMTFGTNASFALYPALSVGACLAIDAHATPELRQRFLPKLYSGEWSGTMCLTESHSGSDLGLIRTRAVPNGDGTYAISGTKIFITGGDHDLTDNIIHLVLAKLPDAPAGSRGISLFLVPKIWVNEDESLGGANGVSCGSIEHKMGIKASATCVMNFDGARGYLVGEINRGLNCMFTMMNCERLSIGLQGVGAAEASYQNAVAYARERLQGRDVANADKSRAADPIIGHADVRRMLMNIRSTTEAGRALAVYLAMQLDAAKHAESDEARARADGLSAMLIPVAKAFFTDLGLESTVQGQQVFGGHGYIREWGQEQLVRDVRIAQIYEGTNGIQAMDLVQRKVFVNRGEFMALFLAEIDQFAATVTVTSLQPFAQQLKQRTEQLRQLTAWLLEQGEQSVHGLGAAACDYLHVVGYVSYAWLWLRMMAAAQQQSSPFANTKLKTGAYFFNRVLPRVEGLIASMKAGDADMMALAVDEF